MAKDTETYVVNYAKLWCDRGSQYAYFNPDKVRGTTTGWGQQGIETDNQQKNVYGNFGTCTAISGENNQCTKSFEGIWQNTSRTAYYSQISNFGFNYKKVQDLYLSISERPIKTTMNKHLELKRKKKDIGEAQLVFDTYKFDFEDIKFLEENIKLMGQQLDLLYNEGYLEDDSAYKIFKQVYNHALERLNEISDLYNISKNDSESEFITKNRLLISSSKLHCSNEGVISIDHSGQVLYATMDEALDQDRKELRKRVRVAITKHYEGQSNASEQALRTIRKLNMNDSDSENKGREDSETSHTPENSAYKLIAWIVLLEPETNEDRTALLEDFAGKVEDGYYQSCSLFEWDADKFAEPYFTQIFISSIKADAYLLSPESPMNPDDITTLGDIGTVKLGKNKSGTNVSYNYNSSYSSHRGIDLRTGHITGDPIYSTKAGIVERDYYEQTSEHNGGSGYGNYVQILDYFNKKYIYGHMHPLNFTFSGTLIEDEKKYRQGNVEVGQFLLPGKMIGNLGDTGSSSEPHLHYEIRKTVNGKRRVWDPAAKANKLLPDLTEKFNRRNASTGVKTESNLTHERSVLYYDT